MKSTLGFSALVLVFAVGCGGEMPRLDESPHLRLGTVSPHRNGPITCAIQTYDGHYLTAVGGGGQTVDAIHTDATWIRAWERFTLIDTGVGSPIVYGIQTVNGHYLTAVGGGGQSTNAIHTDATQIRDWEKFQLTWVRDDIYGIQTVNHHYLSAVGGGGRTSNAIVTTPNVIDTWEGFGFICGI